MQLLLPWQLVGQGMGGCPVTSTSLKEILFSGNGCAVAMFWGRVSRAEKEHFTEGVEIYLQNPLDLLQAAVQWGPVKVHPKKRLCHQCSLTLGRYIPCFGHADSLGGISLFAEGTPGTHQLCLALSSSRRKLSLALSSVLLALL